VPPETVTSIEAPFRGSRRRVVTLDGEDWRTTSADTVDLTGVAVGDDVDPDDLAARLDAAEPEAARARALRMLDARDRSQAELASRLRDDGYSDAVSLAVADSLADAGVIDDARLAEALVAAAAYRKGYGRRRVLQELRRRGISDTLAATVLDRDYDHDAEVDQARHTAERLRRTVRDSRRLAERLVRRGFGWETAVAAAGVACEDAPEPS
jgi:regulatory protein